MVPSIGEVLNGQVNISLFAIPAYYGLALFPHLVAIHVGSAGNPFSWDNRNPRASGLRDGLTKKLEPAVYARYERAEAAHYNTLESIPLFFTAVILGNYAKLPVADLNKFVLAVLGLRVLFQQVYINTSSKGPVTYLRTAVFFAQVGVTVNTIVQAALKFY